MCNHSYKTLKTRKRSYNGIKTVWRRKECKYCGVEKRTYEFTEGELLEVIMKESPPY